jgi:hypothetical protein
MSERTRKDELASFLKSRRYRLTPEEVGLPRSGRRRIATLRREDVAWLADVGITWYTWLEQGRPIKIAHETLRRIAAALRMNPSEAEYLEKLVHPRVDGDAAWRIPVSCSVRSLVESYTDGYASVTNARRDILACNAPFARLWSVSADGSQGRPQRNLLWMMFTAPCARALFAEWNAVARRMLATFRFDYGDYVGDAAFESLIAALFERSSDFAAMWNDVDVLSPAGLSVGDITDPELRRRVALETVTLAAPDAPGQTLTFYVPARCALPEALS